jgi:hypothetical protein
MNRLNILCGALAATVCVALASSVALGGTTTILADNFTNAATLAGRAPTTPQVAGDTWTDGGNIGSAHAGVLAIAGTGVSQLPFRPSVGQLYTLSADVNSTRGLWMEMGFQHGTGYGTLWDSGTTAYAWALLTAGAGGTGQFFAGAGTSNNVAMGVPATAQVHHMVITLDTTASQWAIGGSLDGVAFPKYTYSSNPAIDHIQVGCNSGGGDFRNLLLTATGSTQMVPEPSVLMLGMAGAGLLLRRRA